MLSFAALLGFLGSRESVPRRAVQVIIIGNLGWTAGSLLMLIAGWVEPTVLGVAAFASLQAPGLRRAMSTVA